MATEYKDWFTLDGRVKPVPGVTKAKVEAVRGLVESAMRGSRLAAGTLVEAVTTSDAAFNLQHLININFLPQYDEAPRTWTEIADTRGVADFRPAVLYSMSGQWDNGTLGDGDPRHVAPVIPEGTAYPEASLKGEESKSGGVEKRGFKTSFTFEAFINDAIGWLRALPGEMLSVALDTEEYEVYSALLAGLTSANDLAGGTNPEGTVVPANSALTRAALIQAITEIKQRKSNGRYIQFTGGFNLMVAPGQGVYANFILNQALGQINTNPASGTPEFVFAVANGYNPLAGITVVESEYFSGSTWALVPKKGTTRRPVLERLQLIGHETPELRVSNFTGSYIGGGVVSPFEGSFDADEASYRLRLIGKGALWSPDHVIWSEGDNT